MPQDIIGAAALVVMIVVLAGSNSLYRVVDSDTGYVGVECSRPIAGAQGLTERVADVLVD